MTIYTTILNYLRRRKGAFGGEIEVYCSQGHKPSTISRRLRELEEAGDIIASYVKVPNVRNAVVYYKINPKLR